MTLCFYIMFIRVMKIKVECDAVWSGICTWQRRHTADRILPLPPGRVPVVSTASFVQFQYGVTRLCFDSWCVRSSVLIWSFQFEPVS